MMLVKALYQEYDYILLLDTEGLRSPDFNLMPGAEIRDNTLATFAILPAQGTILLNKGEINQALEDVLPIVLYLYATSSLSLQHGGQIPSKLFFVYNQIDPSQPQKGMELLQDLTTRLSNVTDRIVQTVSSDQVRFYGFEQCRLDLNNLSNSDFRILSINTNDPPINRPAYSFGEESLNLRQWIDQRIVNVTGSRQWQAQSLTDLADYFQTVSDMIRQAPHIASVSTALELWANNKLNDQIEKLKHNISDTYHRFRKQIEDEVISKYTNSSTRADQSILSHSQIEDIINQAHGSVLEMAFTDKMLIEEEVRKLIRGTKREVHHFEDWKFFLEEKEKRNLNGSQKRRIFDDVLKNRIQEAQEPYRRVLDIPAEIKAVYNSTALIQDIIIFDETDICHGDGTSKRSSKKENEPKYASQHQSDVDRDNANFRRMQELKKYNETIDLAKSYISELIISVSQYEPTIVQKGLQYTYRIIDERQIVNVDTTKDVHREVYCYVEYRLKELQQTWNANHNRTKRLEQRREELWAFFQKVVEGIRGIKLFELMLYEKLKNLWQDGFIERLVQDVAADVGKERWIGNNNILQAYIDREKTRILKEYGIHKLIMETSSATTFYEKFTHDLVQVHVDKYAKEKWKVLYDDLKYVIIKSGNEAKNASNNRLNIFLQTLRSPILPTIITSQIPNVVNDTVYGNADEEPIDIFDGIVQKLKTAVPEKPESLLRQNETKLVLNNIQENAAGDNAKPRCNHACTLCGAPCFKHSGHHGHHDFHHQPAGLIGLKNRDTNQIVHHSCHQALAKNHKFSLTGPNGIVHSYTEFPQILNYEVPIAASQRNPLGEYLMSKYHKDIADFFHLLDNPSVPLEYEEHTLEKIEEDIERQINPIR